jgi:Leucine-rich repeat (LRR) protein
MPLTYFYSIYSKVADLSPLAGMPLEHVICGSGPLTDLTPLKGMRLKVVSFNGSRVIDLTPLGGMPLESFSCTLSSLSDLSPLRDCPSLTRVSVGSSKVTAEQVAALKKSLPDCKILWDDPAKVGKSWETPAFQQWVKETQALPADKQLEAVSKKLMELNPGFDGKLTGANGQGSPKIAKGVVTDVHIHSNDVADLSPFRAFNGLRVLGCGGPATRKGKLTDLSPLRGLALEYLACPNNQLSDLSPLAEMPLVTLMCGGTNVADVSPLHTVSTLKNLKIALTGVTAAQVAALQKALPDCKIEWDDAAKPQ